MLWAFLLSFSHSSEHQYQVGLIQPLHTCVNGDTLNSKPLVGLRGRFRQRADARAFFCFFFFRSSASSARTCFASLSAMCPRPLDGIELDSRSRSSMQNDSVLSSTSRRYIPGSPFLVVAAGSVFSVGRNWVASIFPGLPTRYGTSKGDIRQADHCACSEVESMSLCSDTYCQRSIVSFLLFI